MPYSYLFLFVNLNLDIPLSSLVWAPGLDAGAVCYKSLHELFSSKFFLFSFLFFYYFLTAFYGVFPTNI
jgi:hypothetical protein